MSIRVFFSWVQPQHLHVRRIHFDYAYAVLVLHYYLSHFHFILSHHCYYPSEPDPHCFQFLLLGNCYCGNDGAVHAVWNMVTGYRDVDASSAACPQCGVFLNLLVAYPTCEKCSRCGCWLSTHSPSQLTGIGGSYLSIPPSPLGLVCSTAEDSLPYPLPISYAPMPSLEEHRHWPLKTHDSTPFELELQTHLPPKNSWLLGKECLGAAGTAYGTGDEGDLGRNEPLPFPPASSSLAQLISWGINISQRGRNQCWIVWLVQLPVARLDGSVIARRPIPALFPNHRPSASFGDNKEMFNHLYLKTRTVVQSCDAHPRRPTFWSGNRALNPTIKSRFMNVWKALPSLHEKS